MTEASKGYVSLFDLGESKDDVEVDYNSLYMHHYKVQNNPIKIIMPSSHFRLTPPLVRAPQTRSSPGRSWTRSWTPRQGPRPLDHPGYTASIPSLSKIISPETLSKCICSFRLPVHSLFTLKDQFIAFAGSIHVVIMDIKKKEQHVVFINVSMMSSY